MRLNRFGLQHDLGNQAVLRLFESGLIQSGEHFNLVPLEGRVNQGQIAPIYLQVYIRYEGSSRIPADLTYYVYKPQAGTLKLVYKGVVGGEEKISTH